MQNTGDEIQPLNQTDKSQLQNNINQTQSRPTGVTQISDTQRQPGVNQIDSDSSMHGKTEAAAKKKKIIMASLIGLGVIVVILAIVLPLTLIKDDPNPGPNPPDPYNYQEYNPYSHKFNFTTDWRITGYLSYKSQSSKVFLEEEKRRLGQVDQKSYKPVAPNQVPLGINNRITERAEIKFTLVNNKQARLTIRDATKPVTHIPEEIFPRIVEEHEARFSQLGFEFVNTSDPFWFSFNDIYKKKEIISTQKRKLVIQDKYSEIGFRVPTQRIFGVGTANRQFALTNGSYTLYARGREEDVTDDNLGGRQGSSVHPFVLCQTDTQDFFGLYFVNSAASQIEIVYFDNEKRAVINYQTTGGTLEVYFFLRGTAQEILQMYHKIIGYPMMPPFYALGFYQGSDQYDALNKIDSAVSAYWERQQILEGVMLDNYMADPFELKKEMAGLDSYLQNMQGRRQRVILESPHKLSTKSQIYADFKANGGGIIQNKEGTDFISNGEVYIDFLHENSTVNYNRGVDWLSKLSQFDGLTISNNWIHTPQCNGSCPSTLNPTHHDKQHIETDEKINVGKQRNEGEIGNHQTYTLNNNLNEQSTYNIPFIPGGVLNGNLDARTISLNATNKLTTRLNGKQEDTVYQQYFMHNLNSHLQLSSLVKSLNDSKRYEVRRPFVLSEGTAPGSGFYGGQWVGNNMRTWANLKTAIAQVMNLNLFGVSVSGSDVCGTIGALDEELCVRWVQATAFFPIQRNYYSKKTYFDAASKTTKPTEPSEWYNFKDGNKTVAALATIQQRYSYLRYIYSQLYVVYRDGGAIVRPLFFDNPGDDNAFNNIEDTFMIGDSLKISPCLKQGVNIINGTYTSYFPAGTWADLNDYSKMLNLTVGQMVELQSRKQTNIHLKAGSIVPYQDVLMANSRVTQDLQTKVATTFIVMRDESLRAEGQILIDDGLSIDSYERDDFTMWKIRYAQKSISFWVQFGNFNYFPPQDYKINKLEEIIILQAEDLADTNFACYLQKDFSPINLTAPVYNPEKKTLTLRTMGNQKVAFHEIGFIKFGNSAKEPNFCDSERAFTYQITKINTNTQTEFSASLVSRLDPEGKLLDKLVFSAKLLDDKGTLNVNITNDPDDKYKIEYVTEHSRFKNPVTLNINQFLSVSKVGESFTYSYLRKSTGEVLYKTNPNKFYLTKHLIFDQGQFKISTNNAVFGIGERAGHLFYRNETGGIHTRYTLDQANPVDDGVPPGRNMYGVQPFYLYQHEKLDYVGVLSLNSYAHDFILYQNLTENNITNIMIGGKFEKYFFQASKPDQIVSLYQNLVGFPQLPPFWAFGWQQCRFGYKTDGEWWAVYENYKKFDLPIDVMWADIDYMDDYKLFTYSKSRYNNLPQRTKDIKAEGRYFVPIMDPGVAIRDNYSVYSTGKEQNIFIRTHDNSDDLIGGSWCGDSVFPDFHHPKITSWWGQQWEDLNNQLSGTIDGIWIDVNEATNKCNGYCHPEKQRPKDSLRNKAYYVPGQRDLEDQALGVDGLHANSQGVFDTKNGWREYDVHNLYGLMQVKASWEYLNNKGLRPYVLTRSNYPGIGKWGHHWLADNWSTIEYLKLSVYGLYGYSVFGIPFIGSDICGFNGDAKPDLCTRWHQLGAFYPFSRNHNQNATTSQEPFIFNITWDEKTNVTYTDLIRTSLTERYSLLQYYYSQFYEYSLVGGSFWKPIFFEWPLDAFGYNDIEINIMLGDALKFSIETRVLPKTPLDKTLYYFPAGYWNQIIPSIEPSFLSLGGEPGKLSLPSAMNNYQIHIRGGYIVPIQTPETNQPQFRKTQDLINAYTDYYILANEGKAATGFIYFDDGIKNTTIFDKFTLNFVASPNKASISIIKAINRPQAAGQKYESVGMIKILGADKFQLDGVKTAIVSYETSKETLNVVYDPITKSLALNLSKGAAKAYSIYKIGGIEFQ